MQDEFCDWRERGKLWVVKLREDEIQVDIQIPDFFLQLQKTVVFVEDVADLFLSWAARKTRGPFKEIIDALVYLPRKDRRMLLKNWCSPGR